MTLKPLFPTEETLGINTDLYELTMAAAYFEAGRQEHRATFELSTRQLPRSRGFLVAAGLEQALHFISRVRFNDEAIQYLRQLDVFRSTNSAFFDYLRDFQFTGDVWALPEGTVFFPHEPLLQVTAPVIEAQVVETYLINTVNFQSMVASKASRICLAGGDKNVIDFGSRRAHSPQAGVLAARAAFIGGCAGTSNVLAGYEMGIPVYGTMAHSFVQFFDQESEAFREFHRTFGEDSVILVDTYDTLAGVEKVLELPGRIKAVRLDSGDLGALALQTRDLLDRSGHADVRIIASGNLNEEEIQAFGKAGVPIDAYGVGTDLVVSPDAPTCDLVYKLVEVECEGKVQPRIKSSVGKASLPFRKQVFRKQGQGGFSGDLIDRWSSQIPGQEESVEPLLRQYAQNGTITSPLPSLAETRAYARDQIENLPPGLRQLEPGEEYSVEFAQALLEFQKGAVSSFEGSQHERSH